MTEVHIDASEVYALADDMRRHADEADFKTSLIIRKVGLDTEATAKILCPVDTGTLMNSISTDFTATGFDCGPTVDYGREVELGVPHPWVITASPGKMLHFVIDGKDVFARAVLHPPMAPQPFMAPAGEQGMVQLESALADLGEQSISAS